MRNAIAPAAPHRPRVLFVGDAEHVEFRHAIALLRETAELALQPALSSTIRSTDGGATYDLIIVGQAAPRSVSQQVIAAAARESPLTPIVTLLGSWAETVPRLGIALPAQRRVIWHRWPRFWAGQLARWQRGALPVWSLPVTAREEEHVLARRCRNVQVPATVAIWSQERELRRLLVRLFARHGWTAVTVGENMPIDLQGVNMGICDLTILNGAAIAELYRFVELLHPAPVLALTGFPRLQDRQGVLAAGAAAVIAKPFYADELLGEAARLAGTRERNTSDNARLRAQNPQIIS